MSRSWCEERHGEGLHGCVNNLQRADMMKVGIEMEYFCASSCFGTCRVWYRVGKVLVCESANGMAS